MPYADNQGVQIHYRVIGEGEPLLMQHGFFSNIEDWYEFGYVEKLAQKFTLIMVDARGHGASDKLYHHESYQLADFSSDIVAVLDQIDLKKAHFFGYSMGGWIGYGMVKYFPARLNKLIIGGSQPHERNFVNAREILKLGIEAWVSEISEWGPYSSEDLERYRKNDPLALRAALNDREDISDILPTMKMPCLFYAGELDNELDIIRGLVDHVPDSSFFSLPDLNHIETFMRGDLVAAPLLEFLKS